MNKTLPMLSMEAVKKALKSSLSFTKGPENLTISHFKAENITFLNRIFSQHLSKICEIYIKSPLLKSSLGVFSLGKEILKKKKKKP